MKEMPKFFIFKSSYSQSPYIVLNLHCKCIFILSFNNELLTAIQTEINWSWSLSNIFVNQVNI